MNKIILISLVASSALFADMATNMVKDVAVSKAKTQAKEAVVKQVAGNDPVKQAVAKKVADKVVGEPTVADKVKGAVAGKVMKGSNAKGSSAKDKATDMAVGKAIGSNPLKKAAAKEAIKQLAH